MNKLFATSLSSGASLRSGFGHCAAIYDTPQGHQHLPSDDAGRDGAEAEKAAKKKPSPK
jgi:hypothetical protein